MTTTQTQPKPSAEECTFNAMFEAFLFHQVGTEADVWKIAADAVLAATNAHIDAIGVQRAWELAFNGGVAEG